jgi:hypothetical protein
MSHCSKSKSRLELMAVLRVISIAPTLDLRDWGTYQAFGHPHEPLTRWLVPRFGIPAHSYCNVLHCFKVTPVKVGVVLSRSHIATDGCRQVFSEKGSCNKGVFAPPGDVPCCKLSMGPSNPYCVNDMYATQHTIGALEVQFPHCTHSANKQSKHLLSHTAKPTQNTLGRLLAVPAFGGSHQ